MYPTGPCIHYWYSHTLYRMSLSIPRLQLHGTISQSYPMKGFGTSKACWNGQTRHGHRILVWNIILQKATSNMWEMGCTTTFCCSYLVKVPLKEVYWQWPSCPDSQEMSSHPGSYVEFSSAVVCSPMHLPVDSGQTGQVKWFHLYKSYSYLNHCLGLIGLTVYEACLKGIKCEMLCTKQITKYVGKSKSKVRCFIPMKIMPTMVCDCTVCYYVTLATMWPACSLVQT